MHCKKGEVFNYFASESFQSRLKGKKMKNVNDTVNEQMKQFAELQAKSMEQMLPYATLAADATSELLRKNYEVMGDWVDFTVEQSQLPLNGDAPSEVAEAQMVAAKKLSETMTARAAEFAEMAKNWGEQVQAASTEQSAPAKAKSKSKAKSKAA